MKNYTLCVIDCPYTYMDWGYVVYNSMWYATWQKVSCDKGLTFELNIFPY